MLALYVVTLVVKLEIMFDVFVVVDEFIIMIDRYSRRLSTK